MKNNVTTYKEVKKELEVKQKLSVESGLGKQKENDMMENNYIPFELKAEITDTSDPFTSFFGKPIDLDEIMKLAEQPSLFHGFLKRGEFIMMVARAGAGKTLITSAMCFSILEDNPDMKVGYFALNSSADDIAVMTTVARDKGLNDRFTVHNNQGKGLGRFMEDATAKELDLSDTIMVIDVFASMAGSVNDKNANIKIMNQIRDFRSATNVTMVVLHYTNKDGKDASGTAEFEQLTDGIATISNDREGDKVTFELSMMEGKRSMNHFKPIVLVAEHIDTTDSVKFLTHIHNTIKVADEYEMHEKNVEEIAKNEN